MALMSATLPALAKNSFIFGDTLHLGNVVDNDGQIRICQIAGLASFTQRQIKREQIIAPKY